MYIVIDLFLSLKIGEYKNIDANTSIYTKLPQSYTSKRLFILFLTWNAGIFHNLYPEHDILTLEDWNIPSQAI